MHLLLLRVAKAQNIIRGKTLNIFQYVRPKQPSQPQVPIAQVDYRDHTVECCPHDLWMMTDLKAGSLKAVPCYLVLLQHLLLLILIQGSIRISDDIAYFFFFLEWLWFVDEISHRCNCTVQECLTVHLSVALVSTSTESIGAANKLLSQHSLHTVLSVHVEDVTSFLL